GRWSTSRTSSFSGTRPISSVRCSTDRGRALAPTAATSGREAEARLTAAAADGHRGDLDRRGHAVPTAHRGGEQAHGPALASYPRPPAKLTLDIDDTVDVVHGYQQLSLFNAHHDERCFMPIHVYDMATSRPVAILL